MDMARPALIVSLVLTGLTLWYTGQWAGKDPRAMSNQLERTVASAPQR